jgi:ATP-dependent Lon protease
VRTWLPHDLRRFELALIDRAAVIRKGEVDRSWVNSAMLSLVTGRKIRSQLAMTGEISLIGNALPVGGVKEKVIAAKRVKMKAVALPMENQKDLNEIPDYIRKRISFRLVDTMGGVARLVFDNRG